MDPRIRFYTRTRSSKWSDKQKGRKGSIFGPQKIFNNERPNTQLHKIYRRSFARVLYFILMKDIGRCLPWMLPGSTRRFSITILRTDTIQPAQRAGIILRMIILYYMINRTRIGGGGYSKHDIITWYDQQAGCNIIRAKRVSNWYIPKKKCVCSTNFGFSVGYVLCTTYIRMYLVPASASLPIAGSALPLVGRATPLLWWSPPRTSDVNTKQ